MSEEAEILNLREQAQAARKSKDYKAAIDLYARLLELAYKDGDELPILICRDFIHYAECLLYSQPKPNPNEEELEIAWDCLEKARLGYEAAPNDETKFIGLIDVHDILGEITLTNGNYEEAANQFKISSEIGLAHKELSWRLPLNSLFCYSNALIYSGKLAEARTSITQALSLIDEILAKPETTEADKNDLNDFKSQMSARLAKLQQK